MEDKFYFRMLVVIRICIFLIKAPAIILENNKR